MSREKTCEELIDESLAGRLADLRAMMYPDALYFELADDGTLDTVVTCGCVEVRFSDVDRSEYVDDEGAFDLGEFLDAHLYDIEEAAREEFYNYGLSFDWVAGDTFAGDGEHTAGYMRYQLSWGGPSDEFRLYYDAGRHLYRASYHYIDWFDGAFRDLSGSDFELLAHLCEAFDGGSGDSFKHCMDG